MIADKENTNPQVNNDMSVVVRDAVEASRRCPQLNTMWDLVGEKAALQEKYRDGNKKQQKMTKNT